MKIKRSFLTVALAAVAGILAGGTALAQPRYGECYDAPVLYSDDGYRGRSLAISESVSDLHRLGMGDDASSVCVPYGWRVILYEDTNYRGDYLELQGSAGIADLKRDQPEGRNWGDRISSAKVFKPRPRPGRGIADCRVPTLYSNDTFRGRTVTAQDSISDLHRFGMGDDASSVCVPAGYSVQLFEDTNYRGRSLQLRGPDSIADLKRDRPDGSDWGDRISSIRVNRGSGGWDRPGDDPVPYPGARPSCDQHPVAFASQGFGGRSLALRDSSPDLHRDMGGHLSSICIPSGWRVILYDDIGYRGQTLPLDGPAQLTDLNSSYWNDRASSVQVYPPGRWRGDNDRPRRIDPGGVRALPADCSQQPLLFADDGFQGRSLRLDNSISDLHRSGFGDTASSICVPSGWRVTLYEDTNYRGASVTISGSASYDDLDANSPDGHSWGDRVSSVRIDRSWRR